MTDRLLLAHSALVLGGAAVVGTDDVEVGIVVAGMVEGAEVVVGSVVVVVEGVFT